MRLHFQGVKKTASGKEQMNATSSDETYNELLANLRAAHKNLAVKIVPKVYEYGFVEAITMLSRATQSAAEMV